MDIFDIDRKHTVKTNLHETVPPGKLLFLLLRDCLRTHFFFIIVRRENTAVEAVSN